MFGCFKRRKQRKEFEKLSSRGVFFYQIGDIVVKADPLETYCRLKEVGLDVMQEDIEGALRGNNKKLLEIAKNIRDAFGIMPYELDHNEGATILDLIRMYLTFYRYLGYLKKNVLLLREFAPGLEQRLDYIFNKLGEGSGYTGESSSSDSTSTPTQPSPSQDLPHTMEQAEPSTV